MLINAVVVYIMYSFQNSESNRHVFDTYVHTTNRCNYIHNNNKNRIEINHCKYKVRKQDGDYALAQQGHQETYVCIG